MPLKNVGKKVFFGPFALTKGGHLKILMVSNPAGFFKLMVVFVYHIQESRMVLPGTPG